MGGVPRRGFLSGCFDLLPERNKALSPPSGLTMGCLHFHGWRSPTRSTRGNTILATVPVFLEWGFRIPGFGWRSASRPRCAERGLPRERNDVTRSVSVA